MNENPIIVDVREDFEYEMGHIPGSIHLPMGLLETIQMRRDQPLYIFCARGNRSIRATAYLTSIGYQAINVVGGMSAWDGPLERGAYVSK